MSVYLRDYRHISGEVIHCNVSSNTSIARHAVAPITSMYALNVIWSFAFVVLVIWLKCFYRCSYLYLQLSTKVVGACATVVSGRSP